MSSISVAGLDVEATGFEQWGVRDIVIEVNTNLLTDARLQVASQRESVLVQTDPSPAKVENATLGPVLDRRTVNDLPPVGRNPFDLAFLAPGVSQAPGTTYGNGVSTPGFVTNFVSDGTRRAPSIPRSW